MNPRILIIVNRSAGSAQPEHAELVAAALAAGLDATVAVAAGPSLTRTAQAGLAAEPAYDAIVAGGGDGTVSAVAAALAGTGRSFAVLPLGTLNHFAKDLGMPLGLGEALAVIARAAPRLVDVGELNGRVFVNNAVIGLYPDVVKDRDRQRQKLGRAKYVAHALSLLRWLWRFPMLSLGVAAAGEYASRATERRTPCIFVGNNRYDMSLFAFGRRARLDGGFVSAYIVNRCTRWGVLGLGLAALAGRLDQARDFMQRDLPAFTVASRRRRLNVAMDGEVYGLTPPLHFRSRPGALSVIAPAVIVPPIL